VSREPNAQKTDDLIGDPVKVTQGRFHVEVPADCDFCAKGATLRGRTAEIDDGFVTPLSGTPVTIHARWIKSARLHVIDAASHAELDDVCILRWTRLGSLFDPLGESEEFVLQHAASPLEIAPGKGESAGVQLTLVRVLARDHAWSAIELDYLSGRDATVSLQPAASLVVVLSGELPAPNPEEAAFENVLHLLAKGNGASPRIVGGPRLRLRRAVAPHDHGSVATILDQPAATGEARFDALPPGDFTVSVEIGDRDRSPLVAGNARVTLVAGATARVELALAHIERAKPVELSGTIFVPTGWLDDERFDTPALEIRPLDLPGATRMDDRRIEFDRLSALPDRPGWYRWNAPPVPPAEYRLTVAAAGFSRTMHLPEAGAKDVEISLPEAATVLVHAVDASNDEPVKVEQISWIAKVAEAAPFKLDWDDEAACSRGRMPAGDGALDIADLQNGWVLDPASRPTTLHAGEQEIVARVRHGTRILLRFAWNGRPARLDRFAIADVKLAPIEPTTANDERRRVWIGYDLVCFVLDAPGRFRVTFPKFDGFQPVAPLEIDVAAQTTEERTIALTLR